MKTASARSLLAARNPVLNILGTQDIYMLKLHSERLCGELYFT